jgi:hypothetical protein
MKFTETPFAVLPADPGYRALYVVDIDAGNPTGLMELVVVAWAFTALRMNDKDPTVHGHPMTLDPSTGTLSDVGGFNFVTVLQPGQSASDPQFEKWIKDARAKADLPPRLAGGFQ